jgi:hypothetical protein
VPALAAWPAAQPQPATPAMATAGATTRPKLTFKPDHQAGAAQAQMAGEPLQLFAGEDSVSIVRLRLYILGAGEPLVRIS